MCNHTYYVTFECNGKSFTSQKINFKRVVAPRVDVVEIFVILTILNSKEECAGFPPHSIRFYRDDEIVWSAESFSDNDIMNDEHNALE